MNEIETAVSDVASKAPYGGAGLMGFGWVISNEFAVLIGLVVGVGGFALNWYYKARDDRRKQREHEARMAELQRGQT